MTIEQAIKHAEEVEIEQIRLMCRYDAASGYMRSGNEAIRTESAKKCEQCAAEHRQLAAFLRELQERRKAPEIIRCGECAYREILGVDGFCDHITGEPIMVKKTDYCSWAERKTDGNTD